MQNANQRLGLRAEKLGIYTVESMEKGLLYFWNDGEMAILRDNGQYIRFPEKYLDTLIEELTGISEDIRYMKRIGVKLKDSE